MPLAALRLTDRCPAPSTLGRDGSEQELRPSAQEEAPPPPESGQRRRAGLYIRLPMASSFVQLFLATPTVPSSLSLLTTLNGPATNYRPSIPTYTSQVTCQRPVCLEVFSEYKQLGRWGLK